MSEENDKKSKTNKAKSEGAKRSWELRNGESKVDRSELRFNYKCFEGIKGLSKMQKEFVVVFMDPPFLGRKEMRYEAYKKVFNPSNDNSCKSNCSALMSKTKIKEAMRAYQIEAMKNHKTEVLSEQIEHLRHRSTYTLDKFYTKDGDPIPLDQIEEEWLVCIDQIDRKFTTKSETVFINYKLCDKDKASDKLQKLLGITTESEELRLSMSSGSKDAIENMEDDGKEKSGGPRIILNMSVGNQNGD